MLNDINAIISLFCKISGLGLKTAKRVIFSILNNSEKLDNFMEIITSIHNSIYKCSICGNLNTEKICDICLSDKRFNDIICVVENSEDLYLIENYHFFNGKYFVLGGLIPELEKNNNHISQLQKLKNLCLERGVKEVVIALNLNLDGRISSFQIKEYLADLGIKISNLATGIPIGGELSYIDEGTLKAAFDERK